MNGMLEPAPLTELIEGQAPAADENFKTTHCIGRQLTTSLPLINFL